MKFVKALSLGIVLLSLALGWISSAKTTIHAEPSKGVFGTYLFIKETSKTGLAKGAEITLKLTPPNHLSLLATMPGTPALGCTGRFTLENNRISISIPDLEKTVTKGQYSYDGKRLILPVLVFGEGEGTSTWEKIDTTNDPLGAGAEIFKDRIRSGQTPDQALSQVAQKISQDSSVRRVERWGRKVLLVTYRSGYREYFMAAGFKQEQDKGQPSVRRSLPGKAIVQMANFPLLSPDDVKSIAGTRFYRWLQFEPQPISRGDAPQQRTALILSPFHTLPVYIPGPAKKDKYKSFADGGEELLPLKELLTKIGYRVDGPIIDEKVTVRKLYDSFRQSFGAVYFHTHGGVLNDGDALIATGQELPAAVGHDPNRRQTYIRQYLEREFGRDLANQLEPYVVVGFINDDVPFISVTSSFFKIAGGDYTSSLVFIDGCEVIESEKLREALKPRSMVGWSSDVDIDLSGDALKPFWACLSLKTRSEREAMDFTKSYLLEIKGYTAKLRTYGPSFDPNFLRVYRFGNLSPESDLTLVQRSMLMTLRDYSFRRKVAGNSEDLAGMVQSLYRAKPEDIRGLGGNQFYMSAFPLGIPNVKEIDEVKGELCGYGGSKARFTLLERN